MPHNTTPADFTPFDWTAAVLGPLPLPSGVLRWPEDAPLVHITRAAIESPASLEASPPELLVAVVASGDELLAIAEASRRHRIGTLALVGPRLPRAAISAALDMNPELGILDVTAPENLRASAFAEVVRRRVYAALISLWRGRLQQAEAELAQLCPDALPLALAAPAPIATLDALEWMHVTLLLGLWWKGVPKPARHLKIMPATLRERRRRLPPGLAQAIAPAPRLERPISVLVVEDDARLRAATGALLERTAERLGRDVGVETAESERAAQRLLENGPRDFVWLDMCLEDRRSGIRLAQWMRAHAGASVLVGKTGLASLDEMAELRRLGAVTIVEGRPASDVVAAAYGFVDETAAIDAVATRMEAQAATIAKHLHHGAQIAHARAAEAHAGSITALLRAELDSARPEGVGQRDLTLWDFSGRVGELALALARGARAQAARMLGVDDRTLAKRLGSP